MKEKIKELKGKQMGLISSTYMNEVLEEVVVNIANAMVVDFEFESITYTVVNPFNVNNSRRWVRGTISKKLNDFQVFSITDLILEKYGVIKPNYSFELNNNGITTQVAFYLDGDLSIARSSDFIIGNVKSVPILSISSDRISHKVRMHLTEVNELLTKLFPNEFLPEDKVRVQGLIKLRSLVDEKYLPEEGVVKLSSTKKNSYLIDLETGVIRGDKTDWDSDTDTFIRVQAKEIRIRQAINYIEIVDFDDIKNEFIVNLNSANGDTHQLRLTFTDEFMINSIVTKGYELTDSLRNQISDTLRNSVKLYEYEQAKIK